MSNDTIETKVYGTGWLRCTVCGLTAPDVVLRKSGARCKKKSTCEATKRGDFGGAREPSTLVRFELDQEDEYFISIALAHRQLKLEREEREDIERTSYEDESVNEGLQDD